MSFRPDQTSYIASPEGGSLLTTGGMGPGT